MSGARLHEIGGPAFDDKAVRAPRIGPPLLWATALPAMISLTQEVA